jgi:DNA polymerase III epsilon subunit-like protein
VQKELWLDIEATGNNPQFHEPTQVSGTLCDEPFNIFMRPTKWDIIQDDALEVQGKTIEDLKTYPEPQEGFQKFVDMCERHVDRFNKHDKAKIFAFNAKYDIDLLFGLFNKYSPDGNNGYKKYHVGNYFKKNPLCVMNAYVFAVELEKFPEPENYQLSTLCRAHGIDFKAHDAAQDIMAAKKLYHIIRSKF